MARPTCVVSPLPAEVKDVGLTGLDNIGNTCFMNAIIQIIANTTSFRDYLQGEQTCILVSMAA